MRLDRVDHADCVSFFFLSIIREFTLWLLSLRALTRLCLNYWMPKLNSSQHVLYLFLSFEKSSVPNDGSFSSKQMLQWYTSLSKCSIFLTNEYRRLRKMTREFLVRIRPWLRKRVVDLLQKRDGVELYSLWLTRCIRS